MNLFAVLYKENLLEKPPLVKRWEAVHKVDLYGWASSRPARYRALFWGGLALGLIVLAVHRYLWEPTWIGMGWEGWLAKIGWICLLASFAIMTVLAVIDSGGKTGVKAAIRFRLAQLREGRWPRSPDRQFLADVTEFERRFYLPDPLFFEHSPNFTQESNIQDSLEEVARSVVSRWVDCGPSSKRTRAAERVLEKSLRAARRFGIGKECLDDYIPRAVISWHERKQSDSPEIVVS
jgi:hypothetical protein